MSRNIQAGSPCPAAAGYFVALLCLCCAFGNSCNRADPGGLPSGVSPTVGSPDQTAGGRPETAQPGASWQARAWLLLSLREPYVLFPPHSRPDTADEFRLYARTQAQLVRSPLVLLKALTDPKVSSLSSVRGVDDPLDLVANGLSVEFPGDGQIMEVRLSGVPEDEAPVLLQALVDHYTRDILDLAAEAYKDRLNAAQDVCDELAEELRTTQSQLSQLKRTLAPAPEEADSAPVPTSPERELLETRLRAIKRACEEAHYRLYQLQAEGRAVPWRAKLLFIEPPPPTRD